MNEIAFRNDGDSDNWIGILIEHGGTPLVTKQKWGRRTRPPGNFQVNPGVLSIAPILGTPPYLKVMQLRM